MAFSTTLLSDFAGFCQTNHLCSPEDRILVAVSGGVDSMVLFDLFLKLRKDWNLAVGVVHVNHQLRGEESLGDEEFIRQAAEHARVPLYCKRVDTMELKHSLHVSKQVAAREARYRFFEEARTEARASCVATAHQADDNAETVLFNALRGTGIRGLGGIPLSRDSGHFVRPLLFAARERILEYARKNRIAFRNDSSNATTQYSRNFLRHAVIPHLAGPLATDPLTSLNRLAISMKRFGRSLDSFVESFLPETLHYTEDACDISIPNFQEVPRFLQEEVVMKAFHHIGIEPTNASVNAVIDLSIKQPGHWVVLKNDVMVQRDRDRLVFSPKAKPHYYSVQVEVGHSYNLPRFTFSILPAEAVPTKYPGDEEAAFVDADRIEQPLTLRNWRHGDWFVPLGMDGKKKLSDYFTDAKISRLEKTAVPVLESNGSIVWLCGRRLDERFKITNATTHAVKLTYLPTTNPAY